MSTEEDTYKRLKGLTTKEAEKLYSSLYLEFSMERECKTIQDVRNKIDIVLSSYGWRSDMLDTPE